MLNSLKQTGEKIGREISRTWDSLSEGWRELLSRRSDSLTKFTHHKEETGKDVLVRIELPGMDKDDCQIIIDGNTLYLSGEKRFERETSDSTYHVMERAYGSFQRAIPLPRSVNIEKAQASFKNGVLTVRLPKEGKEQARSLSVS